MTLLDQPATRLPTRRDQLLLAGLFFLPLSEVLPYVPVALGATVTGALRWIGMVVFTVLVVTRGSSLLALLVSRRMAPLGALAIFGAISVVWAADEWRWLQVTLITLGGMVVGQWIASRGGLRLIRSTLVFYLMAITCASVLAVVVVPSDATNANGQWLGLFNHKNDLGRHLALLIAVATANLAGGEYRRVSWAAIGVATPLVLLSGSVGALTAPVAIGLAAVTGRWLRRRNARLDIMAFLTIAIAMLIASWTVLNPSSAMVDQAYAAVGRSTDDGNSLALRRSLWSEAADRAADDFLLGNGAGFRELTADGEKLVLFNGVRYVSWDVNQAHNGLIDVALQLGIVGIILVSWMLVVALTRGVAGIRQRWRHPADSQWYLTLFVLVLAFLTSYSILLGSDPFLWFVIVITFVARQLESPAFLRTRRATRDRRRVPRGTPDRRRDPGGIFDRRRVPRGTPDRRRGPEQVGPE